MDKKTQNFRLIKGGLYDHNPWEDNSFIWAYGVQSRLMGVTGLIMMRKEGNREATYFFYFDAEEYGFDTFKVIEAEPIEDRDKYCGALALETKSMFGGLGSAFVTLTEKEAYAMVYKYANMNARNGEGLPGDVSRYQYILDKKVVLSDEETRKLLDQICVHPESDMELINYFLMRAAGDDMLCVNYLSATPMEENPLKLATPSTLFRNVVDPVEGQPGTYLCESLINPGGSYINFVSKVDVKDGKVAHLEVVSRKTLSAAEANLILTKEQYVSVIDIYRNGEDLQDSLKTIFPEALTNNHYNGVLSILFYQDNDHVKEQIFRLDNDVFAFILITEAMELVIGSDYPENIEQAFNILVSEYSHPEELELGNQRNIRVDDHVISRFLDSDMDSFGEFMNTYLKTRDSE